jgi:hypothetical protein
MTFPSGFPDRAQSAVVAAQIRAITRMENELSCLVAPPGSTKAQHLSKLGRAYLMEILAVFAREACELGRAGTWTTRRIELEVLEFMRQLAIDFRSEYSHIGMLDMIDHWGAIDPVVLREIKLSDKWKAYLEELLEIAELQSAPMAKTAHDMASSRNTIKLPSKPASRFAKRSEWTRTRLRERGWDHNDPHRHSGPDRKTMLKILAGEEVKEETLDKLVTSLNKKKTGPTVSLLDVPNE